jgi:hypothetical protein
MDELAVTARPLQRRRLDLRGSRSRVLLAALAYAGALAAEIVWLGLDLTPDRYLLVLLAPTLVLRRTRRFLLEYLPFPALILLYDMLRGYAHKLSPHPYYLPQLNAERFLFGRPIPTVRLQQLLWDGHVRWYDAFFIDINRIHFIVPPTLAYVFWLRNRYLFFRYALTFIVISYAGALTFLLFPAAPPWAASQEHLIPHVVRLTSFQQAAAGLPTGRGPLYNILPGNNYAAIPSLHGGYSFLVFLFLVAAAWRTRWRWPVFVFAALYPAAQGFAVVYTANHYIVDLLIGYAYALAAFFGVRALWRWRGWPD